MNLSEPFIRRPVATTLLTLGIALAGALAYTRLPVSPLPQVDFPTIAVSASMAGASPDVMAATVATPLERHLGQIADVTELTSSSSTGSSRLVLQFGLNRNIDGAARDVEAAINAARADLPTALRSNPTYHKVNPADAPILILTLTSGVHSPGQLYDAADTILAQKLAQVSGIGQVQIGGSSLPAVRVELNPNALFKYGIGLEDVRAALASANANTPKGSIDVGGRRYQIYVNDQASQAAEYRHLVIAWRNGAAVRLNDVGEVLDSVENVRNLGLANGKPAVLIILYRQPGANIIATVDRVRALLPALRASIPSDVELNVAIDRTTTIRASLHDVERTLVIAVTLVVLVVFLFLRNGRATLVPAVAVPISILGTFGGMYLLGYSLDNLSLMALIIATGFVVDDAIVVLENITRHLEAGTPRLEAALRGAREVGFTVLSMSLSLVAVFIPILLMGGIVGRLFREFSVTLSIAVLISLLVSLTTTPMLCARFIGRVPAERRGRLYQASERLFGSVLGAYARTLRWALRNGALVMVLLLAVVGFNVYLYWKIPKGFFPQQDTGRLIGGIQADQSISFQSMEKKLRQFIALLQADPAIDTVVGFTGGGSQGGGQTNSGFVFLSLKPKKERQLSADEVIARLRPKLSQVAGARLFLQAVQDIRVGGRQSNAQYQYTLQGNDVQELYTWAPRLAEALGHNPLLTDVNSDQQQNGLQITVQLDRDTASRLGLNPATVDNTLYDAFGQRDVSTIFNALNQYHVVMEVAPQYWQSPEALENLWVSTAGGTVSGTQATNAVARTVSSVHTASVNTAASLAADTAINQATNALANTGHGSVSTGAAVSTAAEAMVPLAAVSSHGPSTTPLAVNHQGTFVASTLSFNLAANASLSQATAAIARASAEIGLPADIHGSFAGTAATYESSLRNEPVLILAALAAVYIVLGVLYESYIHPITILSTLPSAGTGAVLALRLFNAEFSIIALIGVILLIGIVKKNAIMMIDFALERQRQQQAQPQAAIFEASLLRFRPIMMTTMAALFGALPLAFGNGDGAEIRRPLGIAIVGGLIVSQVLTLYTTPVIYVYLDRFGHWYRARWARLSGPRRSTPLQPAADRH
ncbi:MAG TPA: efflux RND transporter permease subunit [Steroidobacteraceae bacterium]|nr:efflux RND transporter permease subunit [Steroidobacteraceae bacterium]